jgi:hypothetical protein
MKNSLKLELKLRMIDTLKVETVTLKKNDVTPNLTTSKFRPLVRTIGQNVQTVKTG